MSEQLTVFAKIRKKSLFSSTDPSQPSLRYRFSGKEIAGQNVDASLVASALAGSPAAAAGTPYLDFGARLYNPRSASWLSQDPLAEKYYISPYAYCAGDPVGNMDPHGEDVIILGANDSSIRLISDQIESFLDLSGIGLDFGGNYSFQDGDEILGSLLDLVGIIDPSGISDGANAIFQFRIGNKRGGFVSAAGALLPYAGDIFKLAKSGKHYRRLSRFFSDIQQNRRIGKLAEEIVTKELKVSYSDAVVGEQITGRFLDGTNVVFDNVVVQDGKIILINETKSGGAVLSSQQKRFLTMEKVLSYAGIKLENLG